MRSYDLNCVENENHRVSMQAKIHEYSYEIRSVSAVTNQVAFSKIDIECVDSVKAKSSLKVEAKIRAKWEKQWGGHRGFRHMLDPGLSTKRIQYSDVRRLDVAYSRLRLGTNGLNENNLFHSGADPMCPLCTNELESTQHFLLECPYHEFARVKLRTAIRHITKRYFSINLLLNPPADVAEGVREALFAYLKEIGYDSKI